MREFSASPMEALRSAWRNRGLVWAMTWREISGRYRGSTLGILWSFISPLLMLGIYTFVFSVVFKARWSEGPDSKADFALGLFAGMLVFAFFSECVTRAPALVVANPNFVKKVVFPLEVLPAISLGSALFQMGVGLAVWLVFHSLVAGFPPVTVLLVPIVVVPLVWLALGLSWWLAALGVFLRDISQGVGIVVTALTFLTPLFYPVSALPAEYQLALFINPLTPLIEMMRNVLWLGELPAWQSLVVSYAVGAVAFISGFAAFQKLRKGFADVL